MVSLVILVSMVLRVTVIVGLLGSGARIIRLSFKCRVVGFTT